MLLDEFVRINVITDSNDKVVQMEKYELHRFVKSDDVILRQNVNESDWIDLKKMRSEFNFSRIFT